MGSHNIHGAVVVEGRVKAHPGSYAGAFHLALFVHLGGDSIPTQLGNRPVGDGINPALVDGMSDAIGVDGRGRGFQVRIGTVQKLVPEPFSGLIGGDALDVGTQLSQNLRVAGMILGKHIQHFHKG